MIVTIDSAGRLVIPKAIREQAGFVADLPLEISVRDGRVEIEPARREVQFVKKGRIHVAVPVEESEPLTEATVNSTRRQLRRSNR